MKKLLKKIITPHRYSFLRDMYFYYFPTKIHRKEFQKKYDFYSSFVCPDSLCFDIGANMGNRIAPILKIGAKVVAVEPQTDCVRYLKMKYRSKIDIVAKGAGASIGTKDFYVSNDSVLSSFSKDWIDATHERFSSFKWEEHPIQIEMTTLDCLIEQYGLPKFIKIDVEGFELEVLKGLTQSIPIISFEYAVPENFAQMVECIKRMEEINKDIEFNYCEGEGMKFFFDKWLLSNEMIEYVSKKEFLDSLFGDIYVREIVKR